MKNRIKKALSLKYYLNKLLEMKESPDEMAKGLALGVFIGFLPINGFQVLIAVTIAALTRVSKMAAAIGTHVTNPWTTIPVLIIDYYVGCFLLGRKACTPHVDFTSLSSLISAGKEIILPMFVGGIFLGTIFSVLSYFGIKKLLEKEATVVKNYVKSIRKHKKISG
ncbi:hypothetical protein CLV27_1594 [Phorcysia thermohydrogeniphila]|uniref:DUF2062 domain-containing protein n=1 Tax=Phorcysia thermohydrogeniphila TaxID=936138 RepID=A0A4R1G8A2_9BACT|nr:hypothetical protein CLV27_1594 [Phorcysia thermohydrogeniphila]